jgi:DNA-binding FadR family transcriptional regulator
LREAIRMLERTELVEMRRRHPSGLVVLPPNSQRVASLARSYLLGQPKARKDCAEVAKVLAAIPSGNPVADLFRSIIVP